LNTLTAEQPWATISAGDSNQFKVKGTLNFETVPALVSDATSLLADADNIKIDFSEVSESNSAGLAFIMELARQMSSQKKSIHFLSLPDQITVVARAYGVEANLGTQDFFLNE